MPKYVLKILTIFDSKGQYAHPSWPCIPAIGLMARLHDRHLFFTYSGKLTHEIDEAHCINKKTCAPAPLVMVCLLSQCKFCPEVTMNWPANSKGRYKFHLVDTAGSQKMHKYRDGYLLAYCSNSWRKLASTLLPYFSCRKATPSHFISRNLSSSYVYLPVAVNLRTRQKLL